MSEQRWSGMLCASFQEQHSKSLLQVLPHGTAIVLSALPPVQGFPPLIYVHTSLLEKMLSFFFFSRPHLSLQCSMLPHNGEENLLPVTFPGVPCCFSGDILNSFWIVPCTLGCVAASSIPAVRIICSLVQKGVCSYLTVGLVSVPMSQWKQKIEGVLNQSCCLSVNLTLPYTKKSENTWLLKGTQWFLKRIDCNLLIWFGLQPGLAGFVTAWLQSELKYNTGITRELLVLPYPKSWKDCLCDVSRKTWNGYETA